MSKLILKSGKKNIAGGRADKMSVYEIAKKHKVDVSVIEKELKKGIKHELEHTDSKNVSREIAMDHLVENPNYYTDLDNKMPEKMKGVCKECGESVSKCMCGKKETKGLKKSREEVLELLKARPLPVGTTRTYKDGSKRKKVAEGKWETVSGEKKQNGSTNVKEEVDSGQEKERESVFSEINKLTEEQRRTVSRMVEEGKSPEEIEDAVKKYTEENRPEEEKKREKLKGLISSIANKKLRNVFMKLQDVISTALGGNVEGAVQKTGEAGKELATEDKKEEQKKKTEEVKKSFSDIFDLIKARQLKYYKKIGSGKTAKYFYTKKQYEKHLKKKTSSNEKEGKKDLGEVDKKIAQKIEDFIKRIISGKNEIDAYKTAAESLGRLKKEKIGKDTVPIWKKEKGIKTYGDFQNYISGLMKPTEKKKEENKKLVLLSPDKEKKEDVKKEIDKTKEDLKESRGKDKKKRKERSDKGKSRSLNKSQELSSDKNIEETEKNNSDSLEQDIKYDNALDKSKIEGMREGGVYYNERPDEIMNVGKDFYGAKRHEYMTYEQMGSTLRQMEEDGAAEKMVNKKTFLGVSGIKDFEERVKQGEEPEKIIYEALIRDACNNKIKYDGLANEELRKRIRAMYVEFCSSFNRVSQNTKSISDFIMGLQAPLKDFEKLGADVVFETIGKAPAYMINPRDFSYLTWAGKSKMSKREYDKVKKVNDLLKDREEGLVKMDYDYAKKIVEGEKGLFSETAKDVKKGSLIKLKEGKAKDIVVIKYEFENEEKKSEFFRKRDEQHEKLKSFIESEKEKYANKMIEKDAGYAKRMKELEHLNYESGHSFYKKKYLKKDGTLKQIGLKYFGDMENFNGYLQSLNDKKKKSYNEVLAEKYLEEETGKGGYTLTGYLRNKFYKENEEVNLKDFQREKIYRPEGDSFEVAKKTKDGVYISSKFSDGINRIFPIKYSDIESVNNSNMSGEGKKRGSFKLNLFVERKALRKGGKKYEQFNPAELQEKLINDFGVKGITFGNSLRTNERDFHLRKTTEALSDLSEILNLSEKEIGANGNLGLAYAVAGSMNFRGFNALYSPINRAINLTKNKGFGSFAHEWGHFLDHAVANFSNNNMASDQATPMVKKTKMPEVIPHGSIVTEKKRSGTVKYFYDSTRKYYKWMKLKKGQVVPSADSKGYSFNSSLNYYLGKDGSRYTLEVPDAEKIFKNDVQKEMSEIVNIGREHLKKRSAELKVKLGEDDPRYQEYVEKIEQSGYYNEPTECLARAFEVYVSDKLDNLGRENTYLASKRKTENGGAANIYVQGEDRKKVYDHFEKIFSNKENLDLLKKSFDLFFHARKKNKILVFKK